LDCSDMMFISCFHLKPHWKINFSHYGYFFILWSTIELIDEQLSEISTQVRAVLGLQQYQMGNLD